MNALKKRQAPAANDTRQQDGTNTGTLSEIKRFYVQNGVTYANSQSELTGVTGNSITDAYCKAQKTEVGDMDYFETIGGLGQMSKALSTGMVLVMSIWDDYAVDMLWLDAPYPTTANPSAPGVSRGTCSDTSGVPADVEKNSPNAAVTFSNIKWGPINSTFTGGGAGTPTNGGGGGTTTSSRAGGSTTTSSSRTSTSSSGTTGGSGGTSPR